ncbi:MAG: LCP family protein [Lachnospiraceae bacterium]
MSKELKNEEEVTDKKKGKKVWKILLLVVEVLVIVGLIVFYFIYSKMDQVQEGQQIDKKELKIDKKVEKEVVSKGYKNIALFGLDNRTNGNFASGNSDVIMIASINEDTHDVKIVSVYRDTYLNLESEEKERYFKANEAYQIGGPVQALRMIDRNLDLDITQYVSFDFNAVAEVVDLMGGVEVELTDDEALYMTGYITEIAEMSGKSANQLSSGGTYTLDGVQATAYARLRKNEDDYRRTQRQRLIIEKLFEKAKTMEVTKLNEIADKILSSYVETNLSKTDILDLLKDIASYNLKDTTGFPFDKNTTTLSNSASVVVPCDLISNVQQLHSYMFENQTYTPSDTVKEISDHIVNQTGMTVEDGIKQQENTPQGSLHHSAGSGTTGSNQPTDSEAAGTVENNQ